jgi:hypothetical protein
MPLTRDFKQAVQTRLRADEISDRDIGRAERLVARNSARLRREWARLHGKN